MNYKLMLYFLTAVLALSVPVFAQDQGQSVDDRVTRMQTELNLTDSQTSAIRPVIKDYMAKREAVLQEVAGQGIVDHISVKSTLNQLKEKEYQKLSQILSEDQMKRWIDKENLRAALNQGEGSSQVEDDTTLTPEGANFKF